MMPLQQRRAEVVWNGALKGNGTLTVSSGVLKEVPVTYSARTESPEGKTSPEELIAAAHATCYAMAFSNTLGQAGTPPERLDIKATCTLDRVEGKLTITTMELDVTGRVPGIDQSKFEAAAKDAGQNCPVSRALKANVDIRVSAHLQ
jgi:lipoyl-dependent peroxiredoxin